MRIAASVFSDASARCIRGASAQELDVFKEGADQFACARMNFFRKKLDERLLLQIDLRVRMSGCHSIEVQAQRIHGMAPGVTFIGYERLEERRRPPACTFLWTILDGAGNGRSVRESGLLGQKIAELQIRINPCSSRRNIFRMN